MRKRSWLTMITAFLLVFVMSFAVGCGGKTDNGDDNGNGGNGGDGGNTGGEDKTYTVTFKDGDEVIYTTTGKTGTLVDIPDAPESTDARIIFVGWEGVDESDMERGKVEIFSSDLTYTAKWYEIFGTDAKYTGTRLGSSYDITVDGDKDEAYLDADKIVVDDVITGDTSVTADVYVMYDSAYIYVFADVKDGNVTAGDKLELRLDTLHSDKLASAGWNGEWGGAYRGEPGPMVEAGFKIAAGTEATAENRIPSGSEFYWEWWSNECKNDNVTFGTSKITDTGYTVEYRINTQLAQIDDQYKPAEGKEIGFGVRIYDDSDANSVAIDNIADYNAGPKKLSNLVFQANEFDDKQLMEVKQIRDTYKVTVDNEEDLLYKDSNVYTFGNSTVKMLWSADKLYVYASLGADTEYVKLNGDVFGEGITLTADSSEQEVAGTFVTDGRFNMTVTYKDGENEEKTGNYLVKLIANPNNLIPARNLYEIEKIEGEIVADGVKDALYGDKETLLIETVSLQENGVPAARGKAWVVWDDNNLYAFVEVTDANVSTTVIGGDNSQNDSVELWLSTCRTLPTASTGWGDANRPSSDYCGEGGWRVNPNDAGGVLSGLHWMYDWADGVPRECVSKITDTGYNVEFKIAWSAFGGVENKVGEIVDILFNINDDDGDGRREGIVSSNSNGQSAWERPYVLDHFKLVDNQTAEE